jgi:hypothetical protein
MTTPLAQPLAQRHPGGTPLGTLAVEARSTLATEEAASADANAKHSHRQIEAAPRRTHSELSAGRDQGGAVKPPAGGSKNRQGPFAPTASTPSPTQTVGLTSPTQTVYSSEPTQTVEHVITLPLRLTSPNAHELPMARHRRVKAERSATAWALVAELIPPRIPTRIRLTRRGPGTMDSDNLIAAFKAIRDAIARHCGFDDALASVQWVYGQQRSQAYEVSLSLTYTR